MVNLEKDIEKEIESIISKYQKREVKLLNYLIVDDEKISNEDLAKISDMIKGEYISTESINQEYRIKFKYGL